jgi:hypothetical protein
MDGKKYSTVTAMAASAARWLPVGSRQESNEVTHPLSPIWERPPSTPLNGDPLIGHPRKWEDWGRLSTHVMTEVGKDIAKAFYGGAAKHS